METEVVMWNSKRTSFLLLILLIPFLFSLWNFILQVWQKEEAEVAQIFYSLCALHVPGTIMFQVEPKI